MSCRSRRLTWVVCLCQEILNLASGWLDNPLEIGMKLETEHVRITDFCWKSSERLSLEDFRKGKMFDWLEYLSRLTFCHMQSFPRKVLEDEDKTLEELGCCPQMMLNVEAKWSVLIGVIFCEGGLVWDSAEQAIHKWGGKRVFWGDRLQNLFSAEKVPRSQRFLVEL